MSWAQDAEVHHAYAVAAAVEGLRDPALGTERLAGEGVRVLAEAAVSSATPFVRAPLLAALAEAAALHAGVDGHCPECGCAAPCRTARALGPA